MICMALLSVGSALAVDSLEDLKTPAERSNWELTTSSQEVLDFCAEVAKKSEGRIRLEYLTRTVQGRLQPLLIMGSPAPADLKDVPGDKAIALVNCNIHSGEVEGKESMLIFAREVALGKHDDLLKDLVILLNPNMSPDGNDNLGTWRRRSQFTPKLVGTRDNGQGYNINRDMTKLDAYEARAMVEVMNKWDPVIFIDAHATNGSYMRHAVTYNWGLHPNTDPGIMAYNRDEFSRKALGSDSYLFKTLGAKAVPYGNWGKNYSDIVEDGWWTFEDYPRYTTNYAGLRNRLALLLEVYSYDDFKTRIDTQYACIYGALQTVAADKVKIKELISKADERSLARATTGIPANDAIALDSEMVPLDDVDDGFLLVDSYEVEANGKISPDITYDSEKFPVKIEFPAGERTYKAIYYGKFVPKGTEPMGALYILRPGCDLALDRLLRHGIEVKRLTQEVKIDTFKWFKIDGLGTDTRPYEGHYRNAVSGDWVVSSDLTIPVNSIVVSTAQKNGSLAALLLEPECVDGFAAWNILDNQIFNESSRYDRFSTVVKYPTNGSDRNTYVLMPIWKFDSYDAIPDTSMETVGELPHDETLPSPVESVRENPDGGGGGCVAAGFVVPVLFVALAFSVARKRSVRGK
jgi:hypothetical protein